MNRFARQELIQGWNQSLISSARVLVVGAGTTGNEVIKNLALLGFGSLTIVDLDCVEEVNLSRSVLFRKDDLGRSKAVVAADMVKALNPSTEVNGVLTNVICGFGNLEYGQYDCVILTVDNLEARMWVSRYCWMSNVPYINTGVSGLNGNVTVFFPPDTSCLECSWTRTQYAHIAEKYSCLKIGIDALEPKIPMVITSAAVIGGIAAQEAVRVVSSPIDRTSKHMYFAGDSRMWMYTELLKSESCLGHTIVPALPDERDRYHAKATEPIDSVVDRLRQLLSCELIQIQADKALVNRVGCRSCTFIEDIPLRWLTSFERRTCVACGGPMTPLEETFTLSGGITFVDAGIPRNHLLSVAYLRDGEVFETWIHLH